VVNFPLGSLVSVLLAAAYYRWGGWRKARLLPRGSAQQAPSTGLGTPASALNSPTAEVSTEPG